MTKEYRMAGIGLLYAMIVFGLIGAKIVGHLAWSWWIVLLPLWGPIALAAVAVILSIIAFTDATRNGGNPFQ